MASEYGYGNVEFRLGEIENLPVKDGAVDAVISNCVINLSPDKEKVFREAHRVLNHGGRMLVSDIVTEEELPEEFKSSLDAWAGCVAGALEKDEYLSVIRGAGFKDVRIVSESNFNIDSSKELSGIIKSIQVEAYKP
jgi:ubiquinone/menaquinone biosynthesis C-methylase UbiE